MNKGLKRWIITLLITLVYCFIWVGLEYLIYESVTDRITDNIMMMLFVPMIWIVSDYILSKKELEKRLNGISIEQVVNGFINQVENGTHEEYERGRILTNKEADDWDSYRAIGTVEEFKTLKENVKY